MERKIEFLSISDDEKKVLLDILGYDIDDSDLIIKRDTQKPHICPITKREVYLKDASILPGSAIVINTSAISLAEYISEYLE
jgi:hypothetical protein